jgi:acetylornithine/N-succinyldiaminopimelate aminotransferase
LNVAQDKVLRFVPPLVVTKQEVDRMIEILGAILAEMEK